MTSRLIINVFQRNSSTEVPNHSYKHFDSTSVYENSNSVNSHMDVHVSEPSDLYNVLYAINRKDVIVNLIDNVLMNNVVGKSLLTTIKAILGDEGQITCTRYIDEETIKTRDVMFRKTTRVLQSLTEYDVPTDIDLAHFAFDHGLTKAGIMSYIAGDYLGKLDFSSKDSVDFYTPSTYIIMDNGKDGKWTAWLNQLSNTFKHVRIRTQISGDEIEFLKLTPVEDSKLRLSTLQELTFGYSLTKSTLVDKGYLEVDPELIRKDDPEFDEDDQIGYRLTPKGLAYRANNTPRISVRVRGVATDDFLINVVNGLYYRVMGYNVTTGEFNLMCEDYSAATLNTEHNNEFFHILYKEEAPGLTKLA